MQGVELEGLLLRGAEEGLGAVAGEVELLHALGIRLRAEENIAAEVRFRGLSISDVLELTVEDALALFEPGDGLVTRSSQTARRPLNVPADSEGYAAGSAVQVRPWP